MRTARHTFALLVVGSAACLIAGCGSDKDKLVGKWKIDADPKMDVAKMSDKMFLYFDFAKDGTFKMGMEVTDPAEKEKTGKFAEFFAASGKYTVNGDTLELLPADGKDKDGSSNKGDNKVKFKFEGSDKLIITSSKGDSKLTRIK
jgi:hypothetical protein